MWLNHLFIWITLMGLLHMPIEGISVGHLKDIETYPDPTKSTTTLAIPDILPITCFDLTCGGTTCSEIKRTRCYPRDGKDNSCIVVHLRKENISFHGCEFELVGNSAEYCHENIFCSVCSENGCNSINVPTKPISEPAGYSKSAPLMGRALIISAICVISSLVNV